MKVFKNVIPQDHIAMRVLRTIQEKVGPVAVICGGAPTCIYTGRLINDFDIYVGNYKFKDELNEDTLEEMFSEYRSVEFQDYHNFSDDMYMLCENDQLQGPERENRYEDIAKLMSATQMKINGVEFDVIQTFHKNQTEESFIKEILSDFDLNICKTALTSMGHLLVTPEAAKDYKDRMITVDNHHRPEDVRKRTTKERLPKYLNRFECFGVREVLPKEKGDEKGKEEVSIEDDTPFLEEWTPHSLNYEK